MTHYSPQEIDSSNYGYQPSLGANMFGLVAFALIFLAQVVLSMWYRQWWWFVTWFLGVLFQLLGYIGRVVSHFDLFNKATYKMQLALLIISPALLMAGIYYQLAKLVTVYGKRFSLLPPMGYSAIFITCDWISIFVQAAGGGTAASGADTNDETTTQNGGWIMVGGLAFQVLTMVLFIVTFAHTWIQIRKAPESEYNPRFAHVRQRRMFNYMLPAIALAVLFVFIRSVYRVAELSKGWDGYLLRTERYFLVLDGLMMLITCAILTVVHPGIVFGKEPIPVQGLHYKKKNAHRYEDDVAAEGEQTPGESTLEKYPAGSEGYAHEGHADAAGYGGGHQGYPSQDGYESGYSNGAAYQAESLAANEGYHPGAPGNQGGAYPSHA